jgi:hypothetical protein
MFTGPYATFPHLAFAAFEAILLRCFAVRLSALALPPLDAPSLDNATAAGFFTCSGGCSSGTPSHVSPMASSITDRASRFESFGRCLLVLLARVGMVRLWHDNPNNGVHQCGQHDCATQRHDANHKLDVSGHLTRAAYWYPHWNLLWSELCPSIYTATRSMGATAGSAGGARINVGT